uniref:late control protein D n=1 Tax=Clostridium sp. TaxID=1506 RepID=UPI002622C2EE
MEAIHKLKVYCPYDILKIEDIEISSKPNQHGYLYLKCLIDDSINFKYSIEASTEDKIMLYEELEDRERLIIFTGIIENIRTTNENGIYYLELEAASSSSILDKEEKTRSFQDAEMSYDDLINEVLKSYKDISLGFTQCMDRPMSIGKPLFQYKETDYEFLKRVASLLGLDLVCDIIKYGNAFYFGRPLGEEYELEDDISYKACKDLERYHRAVTRGFHVNFHDTDFFYYEIENRTKMDIGDQIYFKQKNLYVNQFEAKLHKGELIYKYRFCRKKGIWQDKIYNEKIRGRSLEGEVLETDGEKLKLHLYVDESQEPSKAAWFYYAPPSGNILYSMPIIGETATLYFQDEVDSDPIVTGCVRKNGSTCEQMSNPANRYFATETGDYLDMLPEAINFHRNGLNVNFNDGGGVTFSSSGDLSISGSSVSLSGGSVAINAASKLLVEKNKSSYISLENEVYVQSSV